MVAKQTLGSIAPDGSQYATLTDGSGNLAGISLDTSAGIAVDGTVASGDTDTGNPVKVGAVHNTSLPTVTDGERVDLQATANGRLLVVASGAVAAGATDSGNPVKTGGVYNSTNPTLTNGQRGDMQLGSRGALSVQVMGVDGATGASVGATSADGVATVNALAVRSFAYNYNGTNHNRALSVIDTMNQVGTGIAAAGIVAQFDDTAPSSVTENQFAPVRMSSARALYTQPGPFSYGRATADVQIKAGAGFLHTISIAGLTATPTAGLLTVYDSLTETGTVIYAEWVFATDTGHTITLDVPFATGLYIGFDATLANVQATVSYR